MPLWAVFLPDGLCWCPAGRLSEKVLCTVDQGWDVRPKTRATKTDGKVVCRDWMVSIIWCTTVSKQESQFVSLSNIPVLDAQSWIHWNFNITNTKHYCSTLASTLLRSISMCPSPADSELVQWHGDSSYCCRELTTTFGTRSVLGGTLGTQG